MRGSTVYAIGYYIVGKEAQDRIMNQLSISVNGEIT